MSAERKASSSCGTRFTIPMRGNELLAEVAGVDIAPKFTIPMRGNEWRNGKSTGKQSTTFTIPMRGNEEAAEELGQRQSRFPVYNPHEG